MLNILVVRLRLVGDVALTTPLLRALRRTFPDARLTYVVEPAAAPILHGNPHVSSVVVVPKGRGLARIRQDLSAARALRRARFDVAIDLHGGPRAAWFTLASRAPMRIGYDITGRTWVYTHVVRRAPDNAPRHAVANQWDLLAPLDISRPDPAGDPLEMVEDPAAARRVAERLAEAGISDQPLVVVHVSAGNQFRRWPHESFEGLVATLARRDPRRRIVLTSGPSDAGAARAIAEAARAGLGPLAEAVPELGEFDLAELHALIGRASMYIGGDSGPLHVAATTRTPIVALFGPTLPERSMPWRDPRLTAEAVDAGALECRPCRQRVCVPGDFRCLTRISVEAVVAAAERAMGAPGARQEHGT